MIDEPAHSVPFLSDVGGHANTFASPDVFCQLNERPAAGRSTAALNVDLWVQLDIPAALIRGLQRPRRFHFRQLFA